MKLLFSLIIATTTPVWCQLKPAQAQAELSRKIVIEESKDADAALTKSAGPDPVTETTYDLTKNIVVRKKASGTVEKLPFLNLPVLFQKDTTALVDAKSADNVKALAEALKSISSQEPGARFQIEGHASRDGTEDLNQQLSQQRADAVRRSLVADYNVNPTAIRSTGFGEKFAQAPETALEVELEKDRVVRVVKLK
jgi:outer membrane protein OmpA-like peptidoglycan-associated protein